MSTDNSQLQQEVINAIRVMNDASVLLEKKLVEFSRQRYLLSKLESEIEILEKDKNLDGQSSLRLERLRLDRQQLLEQVIKELPEINSYVANWRELERNSKHLLHLGQELLETTLFLQRITGGIVIQIYSSQIVNINVTGNATIQPSIISAVVNTLRMCVQQLETYQQKSLSGADWKNVFMFIQKAIKAIDVAKTLNLTESVRPKIDQAAAKLVSIINENDGHIPTGITITQSLEQLSLVLDLLSPT